MTARVWLTYAWKDNSGPSDGDVDFVIQELTKQNIEVRYDRRDLIVGQRLWDGIASAITKEAESDAWILFLTNESLQSQPCREELAYALDRALTVRGAGYPLIGLVRGSFSQLDVPPALRTRLCVTTDDPSWASAVASGVRCERRVDDPAVTAPFVPKLVHIKDDLHVFEVRPRFGFWAPFVVAVPANSGAEITHIMVTPTGNHFAGGIQMGGNRWTEQGFDCLDIEGPPVGGGMSAQVFLKLPSAIQIHFGPKPQSPLYVVNIEPKR